VFRCVLVSIAFVLVLGAAAAARTGEQSAQPMTLMKVSGRVDALAQNGRRIAWIKTQARCGRQVQVITLPGRRPVDVDSRRGRSCVVQRGSPRAIALSADGRVLWQAADEGNTYLAIGLLTAALRDPSARSVAGSYFGKEESNPDWVDPSPLPMAGDGKAILYYTRCDLSELCVGSSRRQSAIYRLAGRRSSRLAKVAIPVGLAVSGRRFAVVTNSLRCCSFAPAWSPDGTRLAWIYHGNLWTIRADGTGDRQLAAGVSPPNSSSGEARRPSWSPDGARLVFDRTVFDEGRLRSLGVYVVEATGGRVRRITAGTAPAWSPDGARIAFVRGTGVFTIRPDGTGETRLTATARATAWPLSWSPDSTRIAVSRGGDVYSVRADGAGETRLTTTGRPETQPAWSPDGSRIAYVDGSTIAVVNADGTGAIRLPAAEGRSPAWSPDSKRIAFVRGYQGPLWAMNADGSGQRQLTPAGPYTDWPQWAPGSTIVVGDGSDSVGNDLPNRPGGLRLASPVDGKPGQIAPVSRSPVEIRNARTGRLIKRFTIAGHARAIALGPDYVALLVNHDPGVRVELYSLNGSRRKAVAVPSSVRSLSAAGRSVVFAAGTGIRRLDARTGAVTTLATTRWAPVGVTIEGRRVVWAENVGGAARIRALRAP
jgi:Tol biopolymer transport system component